MSFAFESNVQNAIGKWSQLPKRFVILEGSGVRILDLKSKLLQQQDLVSGLCLLLQRPTIKEFLHRTPSTSIKIELNSPFGL